MVSRIYVEKRPGFDVEARQLAGERARFSVSTGFPAYA